MQISQGAYHRVTLGAAQAGALNEQNGVRRVGADRFDRDPSRLVGTDEEHVEDPHLTDVDGVERLEKVSAQRRGEARQDVQENKGAGQTGNTGNAERVNLPQEDDGLSPTLRAALLDNSRELQVRFEQSQPQELRGPEAGSRAATRVMLDRLVKMTKDRLAQHTGDEPYSKGDYRALQSALEGIRSQYDDDWMPQDEPESAWDEAELRDGPALDAGMERAGEVLAWFDADDAQEEDEQERLDLVA